MNSQPNGASGSHRRRPSAWRTLPKGVWAMGLGSLFMDVSSEMIHSLLPVFMVTTLGASLVTVGLIEGAAEAAAAIVKVFSGVLSDFLRRRKILMILGYGLAAFTKPLFPLAASVRLVFTARFIDRIGKGIRGAPRDALVAELTAPAARGAAYGLRQALDSLGALLGPLLAMLLMLRLAENIRAVMWIAVIPAFIAVALLLLLVHEPAKTGISASGSHLPKLADARRLPSRYWLTVLLGGILAMARFSEAFLILRARDIGLEIGFVPLVMIIMNFFYSAGAYPAGAASDRISHRILILPGILLLIAADLLLALASGPNFVYAGAALWGLHLAFTQGLLSKLVAESVPSRLLGTGFGIYNLVNGLALLLASVVAGSLWSRMGAQATFLAGAGFASIAAMGLAAVLWRRGKTRAEG